ncbi:MAG: EAL domain-containing protein [Gammaproteobacteria bacterium]
MQACRQHLAWCAAGLPPLRIAVNVAGRQFQSGTLLRAIESALRETEVPAEYLELELTEGILARDAAAASLILDDINAMGVQLSIDDFGTGYSSVGYLKRFPLHTLKVDRTFVRDVISDQDDAAICTAIIALAHSLELRVVAEGAENSEQVEFLQKNGCDFVQGYYYSPPVPTDQFAALLAKNVLTSKLAAQRR